MERFRMGKLASGCWCVWCTDNSVNAAVPTKEDAERLVSVLKSRKHEDFDLPAHLLGSIYPQMDEADREGWNRIEAEALAHDLLLDGIVADTDEIYEIIAEFIAQDAEEEQL